MKMGVWSCRGSPVFSCPPEVLRSRHGNATSPSQTSLRLLPVVLASSPSGKRRPCPAATQHAVFDVCLSTDDMSSAGCHSIRIQESAIECHVLRQTTTVDT